ncbi:MFHAS1 [Branchiostoma lanceolatum]|uniref:MFHAS1 protein n=1 Tax=Branchiostoma lanceolatum TaxID=7740 RepID=A0A8K0F2J8_BRALA|nr:MFHAS1 [Branchiostoma lanceolatum]
MGVDLATYRARIGCFQNPTPRSVRCWSQASALLVGVILAQLWDKVTGDGRGEVVSSPSDGVLPVVHHTDVQTYQRHSHPQSSCCFMMMSCLLVWLITALKLLLQAGDIEQNPGPTLRETDTDETEEQSLKTRQNDDGHLELDLSERNMSSVPNQVFQQNDIQVLKLQCNNIKVIPMDIGMLCELKHLDISYNKLSHLPDSMSSLSNLEELNISGNTILEFPKGTENMQSMKMLIYRNNSLVTIPEQVFSFPSIEELDVSDNELSNVSPSIGNLLSLKVLNLRSNQSLQHLPQELCQLSDLEELNLSVCDLGYLPGNIGNLKKLKILNLIWNRISSLPESVFQSLLNLEELNLCDNSITEIPENISNLKTLKSFKVADNQLVRLPTSIVELTELQTLDASFNAITGLPDHFQDFVKIVNLNLKHNQISLVPFLRHGAFPALQEIHLTGNPIQLSERQLVSDFCKKRRVTMCVDHRQYVHLIKQTHSCYDMKAKVIVLWEQGNEVNASRYEDFYHIDLQNQRLSAVPYGLDIHDPSKILLSNNRIQTFPVSTPVIGHSNLTHLDLSHNLLSSLPEEIHLLSALKILDMSCNKFQSIPPGVYELLSLENFNMSYNSVQELPPKKFPKLEKLNLSYNIFQMVPEGVLQTQSLNHLNLLGNDIASLPDDIARLSNLNTLCYDIRKLQNLSHVSPDLKTMPWKNIEWTVPISCNIYDKPTVRSKAHFSARSDVGHLHVQVQTDRKDVTEIGSNEHIQLQYEINCNIAWFEDTLKELILSNCSMQALPEHIFCLSKLTKLDVSSNRLSSFPSKLTSLQSLQVLNVSNCGLTVLPDSIGDFPSLASLDISRNNLKALPNSLSNLSTLEKLSMHSCGCDHQVEYLSNLASLRHVEVDVAQLINIRIHCLDELSAAGVTITLNRGNMWPNVISIKLNELRGSVLDITLSSVKSHEANPSHEKEVSKLHHLQKITLSQNGIQHFPQFLPLCTSLKHLDIYFNAIQSLPDDIGEMKELQYLNLSSNCLKHLPPSIGNLQKVVELVLEYNQIEQLPVSIGSLEKLSILKLSENCLRAVPNSLGNLHCLKEIDLSNNSLESIPEIVGSLKNIVCLDISGNSLSMLPSSICSCLSLETMKLSSNMLCQLPENIGQLENLTLLQASMNRLSVIPSSICRLQHLQTLDVSVNNITELPGDLGDLSSLTALNVGSNHLKELPKSFTKLVNLTSVDISSNDLKALPEEMFEFVNLTEFNIAGNQIDTLPNTICELQNLEYLSLEENNIRVLPMQFGKLHKLRHFGMEQIQDNPMEQPPIEVFEQGMEGVLAYFEELNLSKAIGVPRPHVKALLLGDVAAGKTSLCNAIRLGKSNLTDIIDRTAGIEVHPARLQDSIQVLMHDFGGHKIYHLTHQFFFSNAALYLIVVDLKAFKQSSFDAAVKYWLNFIKARIDSKPVLRIVGSHIDLCDSEEMKEKAELIMKKMEQIEKIEVESLKKHLSDIDHALNRASAPCSDYLEGFDTQSLRKRKKFIEHLIDNRPIFPEHIDLVSCDLSLDGIKQLIENIVILCQDHELFPRRILPTSWYELELAIKTLKQEGQLCYLSTDDVQKLAKEKANMTPARLTRALKYLHDIGEIVHFADSPQLSNFVFHKPQWLMDVFKLMYKPVERFDERFASVSDADFDDMVEDFSSQGIVSEQMIQCLWKQMNLSKHEESMLIWLLQKFDLCFQMPTTENADPYTTGSVSPVYRFPWLLKASAPRQFRQCWKQKISKDEEVLMVVFQLQNYCPVGLFETLSVKLNKYVICRIDWQHGLIAVSKVGENKILVQLEPKQRSEEIVISVRTQSKDLKEAWGVMVLLINATKELLQQWPGVLYCVRVVCPHCLKQGEDKPHRFSGAVLDKTPKGNVVCPKTAEKIDARLIHPEISPAQWQQRRKRALDECGKSPAPEEIMTQKQPRYSEPDPGISVKYSTTVHATDISKDCNTQDHTDTDNAWERFRSMATEMPPEDEGSRLTAHLMESGLTLRPDVPKDGNCLFHAVSDQLVRTGSQAISHSHLRRDVVGYLRQHPNNEQGDHLRAFVPNEDWEGYLQQMSRDGVWGDHVVLQALASMLGRDIRIVSSIDAENYTTILSPMGNQQDTTGQPLLLGHYAENHYTSLDGDNTVAHTAEHRTVKRPSVDPLPATVTRKEQRGSPRSQQADDGVGTSGVERGSAETDLKQILESIFCRLDERDVRLLLQMWSARTNKQESAGIYTPADLMKAMVRAGYITTSDLGMLEKDMIAAGISLPVIVRDIPGLQYELKYPRTTEAIVGPMGGEVEIPGFVKLIVPPEVLQQDTIITISTVDVAAILRDHEGINWISGYPWCLDEDSCLRELLDQVLFSPAVDVNLHGAQLIGPVEVQTWRPPGSEGMECLLLKHHDGEGWTDVTALTRYHIDSDRLSMSLQTFSLETILWAPVRAVTKAMLDAFSSRTVDCSFIAYISLGVDDMEFHLVCRDRCIETDGYRQGFKQCGSNNATLPLYNGDVIKVDVNLCGCQQSTDEENLRATLCKQSGQEIQMRLKRPDTRNPSIGEVYVWKFQHPQWLRVCKLTFKVEGLGDISTRDDTIACKAEHCTVKRPSVNPSPTVPQKKKRRSPRSQQADDGAGTSGVERGSAETVDVKEYFDKIIDKVSHKWDSLARKLGFNQNNIKGIQSTQDDNDHRCREVLHGWRNKKGRKATLQVLKKALIDIGEQWTAEEL